MTTENIIVILLSIIGVLVSALVGFFVKVVSDDIKELKDMFVRHVRDGEIHLPRKSKGVNHGLDSSALA